MSEPFVGQIQLIGFTFAPLHYSMCNGQIISISENQTLFALIGNTFGGDGRSTMALPDLRGRVPIGVGTGAFGDHYSQGQFGGQGSVTLTTQTLPQHTHAFMATSEPGNFNFISPSKDTILATTSDGTIDYYAPAASLTSMNGGTVSTTGGSASHTNIQPCLAINFVIALTGLFPSRN